MTKTDEPSTPLRTATTALPHVRCAPRVANARVSKRSKCSLPGCNAGRHMRHTATWRRS
jgi:hypothetical protein